MEIRKPQATEYEAIYLMGFDVWAEGDSEAEYVQGCSESTKYKSGTWYVLASNSTLMASLIVYESGFKLPKNFCGIGSVATAIEHRHKGYASYLVKGVCEKLQAIGYTGVFLHSDIDPMFYERLGFVQASTQNPKCLVHRFSDVKIAESDIPHYF
jgi:predicted N-acetyltransferase YhbS